MNRRDWLQTGAALGISALGVSRGFGKTGGVAATVEERDRRLEKIGLEPVLRIEDLKSPVRLESVEVLRVGGDHLLKIRDEDGGEGMAVANPLQFDLLIPMLRQRVVAPVLGEDLRRWEELIEEVYLYKSNYKLQGMGLWQPLATMEFAVLDLLGKRLGRPMGALLGPVTNEETEVYEAFGDRESTAERLTDDISKAVEESGARAVKFKVGARMRRDEDCLPGRSDKLPGMLRERLGEEMTLYADANGSYSPEEGIRIGRVLEEAAVAFYEEPCRFDHFADTKAVADALEIPVAGGEQDSSLYNIRWSLVHDALQIVQPDLFYFGGMVRSAKVARMAAAVGRECTPHISGGGLGHVYLQHFVSSITNPGPYHEYKGGVRLPAETTGGGDLRARNGKARVPGGPGVGVDLDPAWLGKAARVSLDERRG